MTRKRLPRVDIGKTRLVPFALSAGPRARGRGQNPHTRIARMRLYSGKIAPLSDEIVKALIEHKEIEC